MEELVEAGLASAGPLRIEEEEEGKRPYFWATATPGPIRRSSRRNDLMKLLTCSAPSSCSACPASLTISSLELPPRCLRSVTIHGKMFRDESKKDVQTSEAKKEFCTVLRVLHLCSRWPRSTGNTWSLSPQMISVSWGVEAEAC